MERARRRLSGFVVAQEEDGAKTEQLQSNTSSRREPRDAHCRGEIFFAPSLT